MRTVEYVFVNPSLPVEISTVTYTKAGEAPRSYSTILRDMGDYLPTYYRGASVVNSLLTAEAMELADINAELADILAQFFIDTATWGLANWERVCAVTTNETKPIEQRRAVIKSKLRGVGTVTTGLIKNVAESFDNGTVEVTENNATYTIIIHYVSVYGIPNNLADIQAALRDIIPAHLAINFVFTYATWGGIDTKAFTWSSLTAHNYTWNQYETLV